MDALRPSSSAATWRPTSILTIVGMRRGRSRSAASIASIAAAGVPGLRSLRVRRRASRRRRGGEWLRLMASRRRSLRLVGNRFDSSTRRRRSLRLVDAAAAIASTRHVDADVRSDRRLVAATWTRRGDRRLVAATRTRRGERDRTRAPHTSTMCLTTDSCALPTTRRRRNHRQTAAAPASAAHGSAFWAGTIANRSVCALGRSEVAHALYAPRRPRTEFGARLRSRVLNTNRRSTLRGGRRGVEAKQAARRAGPLARHPAAATSGPFVGRQASGGRE